MVKSVQGSMLGYYIKSDRLALLTSSAFAGTPAGNANSVNIYIDLANIIRSFYEGNCNFIIENYRMVSSCTINLVAHLRHFYRTYCSANTKVFIIYSDMVQNEFHKLFVPDYYKDYVSKELCKGQIRDMVDVNLRLLNIFCPYIEGVYFIKTFEEFGVKTLDIIYREEAEGNYDPNVIISKDIYPYQVVANHPNTVLFRPSKSIEGDMSWLVNQSNVLEQAIMNARYSKETCANTVGLSPALLSVILSLSGFRSRNIKSYINTRQTCNLLQSSISNSLIVNGYNPDMRIMHNALSESRGKKPLPIDLETLENNFKAIDILFAHSAYMNTPESKLDYKIDLYNPDEVRAINNQYFRNNPLDLEKL